MSMDEHLAEAVKQVAQAKVAEALGGDILGKIVTDVMNHRPSTYSGRDKRTLFEQFVDDEIRALLRTTIKEYLSEHQQSLKDAIRDAVSAHVDKTATSIVDAIVSDDWRADLTIKIERND